MIDPQLQALLVCPECRQALTFEGQTIICPACGSRFQANDDIPILTDGLSSDGFGHDLYHAQLDGNYFEKVFHTNRIDTLMRLITQELHIAPPAVAPCRILDVGCNTGPMVIPLREAGYDVVGVDISSHDVHLAQDYLIRHNLPHGRLAVADGTKLPFRDGSFDLILLVDILEHTSHPERIVQETHRLLAPGGLAVATVPWGCHPYVRFDILRKLLSSRKTIDEHPDAPFTLNMLQSLFVGMQPVLFRLVFHWVCILGVYRRPNEATFKQDGVAN